MKRNFSDCRANFPYACRDPTRHKFTWQICIFGVSYCGEKKIYGLKFPRGTITPPTPTTEKNSTVIAARKKREVLCPCGSWISAPSGVGSHATDTREYFRIFVACISVRASRGNFFFFYFFLKLGQRFQASKIAFRCSNCTVIFFCLSVSLSRDVFGWRGVELRFFQSPLVV